MIYKKESKDKTLEIWATWICKREGKKKNFFFFDFLIFVLFFQT